MKILSLSTKLSTQQMPPIVSVENFEIKKNEFWAVIGTNGSGKSTFCKMLRDSDPELNAQLVSFETEQQLLEYEIYDDDSEFINQQDPGRTPRELLSESMAEGVDLAWLITTLRLDHFIDTGFRLLSTGERRRLMIAIALSKKTNLLILDEPFDGLDKSMSEELARFINEIYQSTPTAIVVNRLSQLVDSITHVACLSQMELVYQGSYKEAQNSPEFQQLQNLNASTKIAPKSLKSTTRHSGDSSIPIVEMREIKVSYHDKVILQKLDWTVMPDEQWRIKGPNGCGKSTLVNLITGDHPQCYANNIHLFGKKRGVGESIWDVKYFMGIMSTTLHQEYRITVTAETVLLSGFFDTIGVYRKVSNEQKSVAESWLNYLGMPHLKDANFQQLSFGQQRMLLIGRALIKRPNLLILDEPCQGLDPLNRALVLQLIGEIVTSSLAQVIYISHEEEDALPCLTHELEFKSTNTPRDSANAGYRIEISQIQPQY